VPIYLPQSLALTDDADVDTTLQCRQSKATSWFPPQTLFFLLLWLILMVAGRHMLFCDPGTFWHTVLGTQIVENGHIPEYDSFTFTRNGERWLALQWAAETAMALCYRIGGWDLQLLLTATLLAFFFTWLFHRGIIQGMHWLPASFLVVVAIGACSHHFHVRPHLASIFLLGWTFARLVDVESETTDSRRLWFLVPVFAVWTNLHGGVLGGLMTVGLWWTAWMALNTIRRSKGHWWLLPLPLALFATFFVNPYGWEMPATWLEIMTLPLPGIIIEHGPTLWTRPEGMAYLAILGLYFFVLVDAVLNSRHSRIVWLLPLIWAVLAFGRVRHVPLFSITACLAIADMIPHTRLARRLERTESFFFDRVGMLPTPCQLRRWLLVPALVVVSCLALQRLNWELPVVGSNWAEPPAYRWPIKTTEMLQRIAVRDDLPRTVFNDLDFGGYIAMHAPQYRTYVDDRCELFGGEFLQNYVDLLADPTRFAEVAAKVDYALVRTGTLVDQHLAKSPGWIKIESDEASTLYKNAERLSFFDHAKFPATPALPGA
jgi:hypothetical protein